MRPTYVHDSVCDSRRGLPCDCDPTPMVPATTRSRSSVTNELAAVIDEVLDTLDLALRRTDPFARTTPPQEENADGHRGS